MPYLDLSIANPSFKHRSRRSGWVLANAPVSHIKLRSAPRALDALSIDERVHLTIDVNRGTGQFAACERVGIRRDVKFRHRISKPSPQITRACNYAHSC